MMPRFLMITVWLASSFLGQAQQFNLQHFRHLAWLQGTWKMESETGPRWETWTKINDSSYRIEGRRLGNAGDTLLVEQVSCRLRSGKLYYIPTVPGQNNGQPVPFIVTEISAKGFTAENPRHDFPGKIQYWRMGKRRMKARISGMVRNEWHTRDFEYRRASR